MSKCSLRDYPVYTRFRLTVHHGKVRRLNILDVIPKCTNQRTRKERRPLFLFDIPNKSFVPSVRLCEGTFGITCELCAHIVPRAFGRERLRFSATFASVPSSLARGLLVRGWNSDERRNRFFASSCGILSFRRAATSFYDKTFLHLAH